MSNPGKSTSFDVADIAGVSRSTVSLVFSNHPGISQTTVLKVREVAKRIGYKPGRASIRRGHRSRPSRPSRYRKMQVALISQVKSLWLQTPVYTKVLHGIEDELGKIYYNFIIRNLPQVNPEKAIPRKIDGAILFNVPSMEQNEKLMRDLRRIPCVKIMGDISENEFFDHVSYNNHSIGKIAAEYLLSKGHKSFLLIEDKKITTCFMRRRCMDFASAVRNAGAKIHEILGDNLLDESGKVQLPNVKNFGCAIEKMKTLETPTAIFVPADIYVAGLYLTLRYHDIIPGKDVEIVGVNNDYHALNNLTPRPASVDIHPEAVGRKAVERLLWRMDNPKEPLDNILIEPEMAFS